MSSKLYRVVPIALRHLRHSPYNVTPVRHMGRWWGDPFSEIQRAMERFDQQMRQMDRDMNRVFGELQRTTPLSSLSPWSLFGPRHRTVPVETSDKEMYRLELNLPDFNPEDVKITVRDHLLSIHARKETKGQDGSQFVREYHHEYTLPKEVNPESVRSLLEADGTLKIEAPLQYIEAPKAREIPVEKESSGSSNDTQKN